MDKQRGYMIDAVLFGMFYVMSNDTLDNSNQLLALGLCAALTDLSDEELAYAAKRVSQHLIDGTDFDPSPEQLEELESSFIEMYQSGFHDNDDA
jgi:hypothetical protein